MMSAQTDWSSNSPTATIRRRRTNGDQQMPENAIKNASEASPQASQRPPDSRPSSSAATAGMVAAAQVPKPANWSHCSGLMARV